MFWQEPNADISVQRALAENSVVHPCIVGVMAK